MFEVGHSMGVAMFYVGLDLGQRHDPTAIAIVERLELAQAWQATAFPDLRVRHLERVALGTPYPAVVARVREIVRKIGACVLVVDGTGVGAPVVDMLRAAGLGCEITAVTITGGEQQRSRALRHGACPSGTFWRWCRCCWSGTSCGWQKGCGNWGRWCGS